MMHLYSAFLCLVLHPKHFTIVGGGGSPQPPPVCSIHFYDSHGVNQVYALTTHQLQVERRESHRDNQVYALTTHQLQVERRESHRDNRVYALTTHQLQVERRERQSSVCGHHTPATGGEERET